MSTGRKLSLHILRFGVLALGMFIGALALWTVFSIVHLEASGFRDSARALVARSAQIRARANRLYQAQALAGLSPSPKNGPFYRFDEQLDSAVVLGGTPKLPAGAGADIVFALEFDDPERPGLVAENGRTPLRIENGVLKVRHNETDFLTNDGEIAIPIREVGEILIRARADRGKRMILNWRSGRNPNRYDQPEGVDNDLVADSRFRTYSINGNALRSGFQWGDTIRTLMLHPSDADGASVEIDYIRFVSKRAKYARAPHGADYERVGDELRRALYMHPQQTLGFPLAVPERAPRLSFGTAVVVENDPLRFEVLLSQGAKTEVLFDERRAGTQEWQNVELNLDRWAGQQVRIAFRVSGARHNIALWGSPLVYSARREPFNVILLVEDALRADRLGMYGHHRPTSPVRDSIADDGVLFLNPIAQATETRASVPALMTSLLPSLTGVWDFKDRLKDEYLTLAEVLRAQGFVTAAFVQNGNAGPYAGLHQGFTSSFDTELIGKKTEEILGGPLFAWLEKHRERNFFTYLHITDPHGVYDPPPPFDRWYHEAGEARRTPVERLYLDPDWEKNPTKEGRRLLYDGEIRNNDRLLEGLLDKLEELGIRENTLLVMTSDHGEYLGEGGHWMHKPPGRLQVLRVPLVMSYPARFKEPRQISSTVQSIDVMPTILELAGIDSGGLLMQGDSLVDLIEGRRPGYWENRICLSEEPIVMSRQDHQAYGSMFFRQLHVNNSPLNWPGRLPAWLKMRVFNFEKDRTQSSLFPSLLPDLWLRYQFLSVLSEVFDNNIAAHAKLTGGTDDTYKTDIEVLRQLRSLGYVQ